MPLRFRSALALIVLGVLAACPSQAQPERRMAVTVDDLPVVGTDTTLAFRQYVTSRLVGALRERSIPAIGFVNERKMYRNGVPDPAQVALLQTWIDAGMHIGNHTYAHPDLNDVSLAEYEADILRGETITTRLLGKRPEYFRHPYLHAGATPERRDSLLAFLAANGYTVAPVTIDNADWIFAAAYMKAHAQGDAALKARVAGAYAPYMEAKVDYFERQAEALLGRPIPHILLIHASLLNAEHFGAVADRLRARGYRYVALADALADPAYRQPDGWAGKAGISWLHRWALGPERRRERLVPDEPRVPGFVLQAAGIESE